MTLKKVERIIEMSLYLSRWVMAPVYLGLSIALCALTIKFFQELIHFIPQLFEIHESVLILNILTLIDITLVGNLLVIVMFSGYENFVSRLDMNEDTEKLDWLGTHDYGALKMKVAASIVAISSIHLLKIFMNIETMDDNKLIWYVVVHLTLVISALFMGYLDKITRH